MSNHAPERLILTVAAALAGAAAAIALCGILTLLLSFGICLGAHPEAAMNAEWVVPIAALVCAGALVRRAGAWASIGAGAVVGLAWAVAWLYLMGRWDPHLWRTEALPELTWRHMLAWLAAPVLAWMGGAMRVRAGKRGGFALYIAALVVVMLVAAGNMAAVERAGHYQLARGVKLELRRPDRDGTTTRLLTFDFAENPQLRLGIYDRDSHDSHPFDDIDTSYLGTPAVTVFEKLGREALCVVNAGFFTWTEQHRIGSHVAPVVQEGTARYDLLGGPDMWTFGWKTHAGRPAFHLARAMQFEQLSQRFDWALGHVRPLVVDGKAIELGPGAGVTTMRCSRTSIAWSRDSSRLYLLVVRDADAERASINAWKRKVRQVGGWDLPQLQQYWMGMGVDQALALDGGDSTQLVYTGPRGTASVGAARIGRTLGYINDRPLRIWIPILPVRHSDTGVMNYLWVGRR